jgi:hypothetical protein
MQPVWASGRVETVLRWMTWFDQGPGSSATRRSPRTAR